MDTWLAWPGTPGVWARLRAEADAAFGDDARPRLGPRHCSSCPTRRPWFARRCACIRRCLLAAAGDARHRDRATHDPQGSFILLCPYLAGRDARCWPDPLRFDPDRHLSRRRTDPLRSIRRGCRSVAGRGTASGLRSPRWSSSSSWPGSRNDSTSSSHRRRCPSGTGWW